MNLVDALNQRALGFAFKKEDKLVDLRLKNLKKETLLKNDGPLMNVSFDPSRKSDYVRIAVGHEDGIVSIHQVDHEYKETTCCRVTSHLNCIYDIVWSHDGEHIFTACGDGSIGYHQIEAGTSYLSNENIKFLTCNSSSMKSVVVHPENPNVIASGSSDGNIFVWDIRVLSKPDISIRQAYSKETKRKSSLHATGPGAIVYCNYNSIRSMVFQDSNKIISSCSESPYIKIWDLRRTYCNISDLPKSLYSLESTPPVSGFTSLALDPSLMRLYARGQDSTILLFDVANYKKTPVAEIPASSFGGPISFHIKIKLSPDWRHLVAGSDRGILNIWNTKTLQPLFEHDEDMGPQFEELTGVDWIETPDKKSLICGGREGGELCLWSESFPKNVEVIEDPPLLNIQFSQLQIKPQPRRPSTPPVPGLNSHAGFPTVDSPTINLPSFVEDSTSHPVTKPSSTQKPRTPNNWLVNLRKEITPKRNSITDSAEKNRSGKKSRRRLNSSPGMSLTEFMQHHCKVPRLDSENHPLNS
ncbi:hypothetical protein M8J77_021148 [Diaphorina citri]|nr:hypothetical protein M8J77_021148 [Diaphorina citri]